MVRPPYVTAILEAGGLPVPLPFVANDEEAHALLDVLDGVLLSGSEDLDSALWGEALHPKAVLMHPLRQAAEWAYCRALLHRALPVLGVCGGMQTLAMAAGGRLAQHIPDLGPHVLDHAAGVEGAPHDIEVSAGSLLASCLGRATRVNTAHHQALLALGAGMVATAHSPDGILEGYEMPDRPFTVGVQWHPERMPDDAGQARLLRAFVAAARTGVPA